MKSSSNFWFILCICVFVCIEMFQLAGCHSFIIRQRETNYSQTKAFLKLLVHTTLSFKYSLYDRTKFSLFFGTSLWVKIATFWNYGKTLRALPDPSSLYGISSATVGSASAPWRFQSPKNNKGSSKNDSQIVNVLHPKVNRKCSSLQF